MFVFTFEDIVSLIVLALFLVVLLVIKVESVVKNYQSKKRNVVFCSILNQEVLALIYAF